MSVENIEKLRSVLGKGGCQILAEIYLRFSPSCFNDGFGA